MHALSTPRVHTQENRHKVPKSVSRTVLGRMQFTLYATRRTPHGAWRLVQAMSAWLVKARRAPSRQSRDGRVDGHTTTAMHKLSTPPPPVENRSSLQTVNRRFWQILELGSRVQPVLFVWLCGCMTEIATASTMYLPPYPPKTGRACKLLNRRF